MHASSGLFLRRGNAERARHLAGPDRQAPRAGFTLLEILLVIALIGLLAAALVGGASSLLNTQPSSADDVFWASVQEARKLALQSGNEVVMKYVDDKDQGKAFVLTSGGSTKAFPIPKAGDLEVTFLSQQKGGTMVMVAGTVLETQKIESATFYPDGTCSPFRVQFYRKGAVHVATIDQWTCAPMLKATDPNSFPRS